MRDAPGRTLLTDERDLVRTRDGVRRLCDLARHKAIAGIAIQMHIDEAGRGLDHIRDERQVDEWLQTRSTDYVHAAARTAARERDRNPSFPRMCLTCTSAVPSLMKSACEVSRLLSPTASRRVPADVAGGLQPGGSRRRDGCPRGDACTWAGSDARTGARGARRARRAVAIAGAAAGIAGPSQSPALLLVALLLSAVLGGLHGLTPGHGKAILASYLVGSRGTARHALLLGGSIT